MPPLLSPFTLYLDSEGLCFQKSHLLFSEVLKALHNTRELYERWRAVDEGRDIRSIEEQEWAATELRNALRFV